MAQLPDLAPERMAAAALDNAFVALLGYYGQSKGTQATALVARLRLVFPNGGRDGRPEMLWPQHDEEETPEHCAWRGEYYHTLVRPVLASDPDDDVLERMRKCVVRIQQPTVTLEQRDGALAVLELARVYWDNLYPKRVLHF